MTQGVIRKRPGASPEPLSSSRTSQNEGSCPQRLLESKNHGSGSLVKTEEIFEVSAMTRWDDQLVNDLLHIGDEVAAHSRMVRIYPGINSGKSGIDDGILYPGRKYPWDLSRNS